MNKFYFCLITPRLFFHYSPTQQFEKPSEVVRTTINKTITKIQLYTSKAVSIKKPPFERIFSKTGLSVIKFPEIIQRTRKQKPGKLSSQVLTMTLNLDNVQVTLHKKNRKIRVQEKKAGAAFTPVKDKENIAFRLSQSFLLERDEPIDVLRILQDEKISQRNITIKLSA